MSEGDRSISESNYEEIIILTHCEDNLLAEYENEEHVISDNLADDECGVIITENDIHQEHVELEDEKQEVTIIKQEFISKAKKSRKRKSDEKNKSSAKGKQIKFDSPLAEKTSTKNDVSRLKTIESTKNQDGNEAATGAELKKPAKPMPEVKKMKQGMTYSAKEKTIILNVYKYFRLEAPTTCVRELVRRTSLATGCSEKSIFKFRKEEEYSGGCKEPSRRKKRTGVNINSRDFKYNASVREIIKTIIDELQSANIMPTLNTISHHCKEQNLPDFSTTTLRRLMMDMGFFYIKNGNQSLLVQKPEYNKYINKALKTMPKKKNVRKNNKLKINITPTKKVLSTRKSNIAKSDESDSESEVELQLDESEVIDDHHVHSDFENVMVHTEYVEDADAEDVSNEQHFMFAIGDDSVGHVIEESIGISETSLMEDQEDANNSDNNSESEFLNLKPKLEFTTLKVTESESKLAITDLNADALVGLPDDKD